jgi:hypothetical protein
MSATKTFLSLILAIGVGFSAIAEDAASTATTQTIKEVKPFRTFLTIQKYNLENSGKSPDKIFHAQLEITFANGSKISLPEGGHQWTIGNGQSQEINRTFEIPWGLVQSDSTRFTVAMVRSGANTSPCEFSAEQLSQFNRGYICHTDAGFQADQGVSQDKIIREAVYIRVFTDRNANPNDIPKDAIALRN